MQARALPVTTKRSQVGDGVCAREGNDLDLVAVGEHGAQRHDAAVDLRADAAIADLGMDGIGEIDRTGAARQRDEIAFGREAEHLVLEHLELGVLEEFFRTGGMLQDIQQLAQPAVLPSVDLVRALLIGPVRGDAHLGDIVHLAGADLHLDAQAMRADDAGVERLVVVGLRGRDEVLEAARDHRIAAVQHAQRLVAGRHVIDHDAERHDVRKLLELDLLLLHLAPDRIGRLLAAGNGAGDALLLQHFLELGHHLVAEIGALLAQELQALGDRLVGVGIDLGKGQVLELIFELVHAHALGQGRIDLHGLERDAAALLWRLDEMQGLHVVQTVRQLHQQDADVVRHRQHQLAEVLSMLGIVGLQFEARELGDAVHQAADLGAEQLLDLLERRLGVFHGVVKQAGDDRGGVELQPGQDLGDAERMGEVGIAGSAGLRAVRLHRKNIGAVEGVLIRAWIVGFDSLDQFELTNHRHFSTKLPGGCLHHSGTAGRALFRDAESLIRGSLRPPVASGYRFADDRSE